ncbi:MAG: PAS domain-containing protein [Desulfobacterales bacterium]|nr:PAS domain-containing protein [Desulfobacterales bacterium]
MSPDEILESYLPMVDFIANVYGKHCEVILHDLRKLENSIIAIRNNHVTGRNVNDTITDFALDIIYKEKYKNENFICNYTGKTDDGRKNIRASTYFIRDKEDNLIGLLCINVDVTALISARRVVDEFIIDEENVETKEQENFSLSINDHVSSLIIQTLAEFETEPLRMTMEEKKQVVKNLESKGVFMLKGVVNEVAKSLKVSEQTVYRYLKELEKNSVVPD